LADVLTEFGTRMCDAAAAGPLGVFIATVEGSEEASDQVVAQLRGAGGGGRGGLAIPTQGGLPGVGRLVGSLYARAYGLDEPKVLAAARAMSLPSPTVVTALGGRMRAQVRCLIACLDEQFGPPEL